MKLTHFMLSAAVATLLLSSACTSNTSETSETQTADTAKVTEDVEPVETADTAANPQDAGAYLDADYIEMADAKAIDRQVDVVISIYNQNIEAIRGLMRDGTPCKSPAAFRVISNLPDPNSVLKKIRDRINPEQKARIEEASKKLDRVIEEYGSK